MGNYQIMPAFELIGPQYRQMFAAMEYKPGYERAAQKVAQRVYHDMPVYSAAAKACNVPAIFIMCANERESDGWLGAYLGNGQPWNRITTEVPPNRGPFKNFIAGCVDAVHLEGLNLLNLSDWTVSRLLYKLTSFNGWGYYYHSIPSPYIWAGSTIQKPGKYVRDGVLDLTVMDPQLGAALVYDQLVKLDPALGLPNQ